MTDGRTNIAGNYYTSPVPEITVWLDEGTITVNDRGYGAGGRYERVCTFATELYEGDWVGLSNDTGNTFALTFGLPVVEQAVNTETLAMFQIVSIEPAENMPSVTTASDTLAERLAGKFLRKARVRVYGGITGVVKAEIMCNGANACVPGVGTTLNFNMASSYAKHKLCFDSAAGNGVGVVPFHYVGAGVDGDLYDSLVGITGAFYSVTGV